MENLALLEELFDQNIIKIIQLFISNKGRDFYLREISKESNVSIATTSRIMFKLVKLNIIVLNKVNKFKLYTLNVNSNVKYLESFMKKDLQILDKFIESIKHFSEVDQIILHGEEMKDRANVFLIGNNINTNAIKEVVANIKEGNKFTVSALVLTKEQYDQMSQMGLYSGKKKVIFNKT
jgi:predicted transcriptional regulator